MDQKLHILVTSFGKERFKFEELLKYHTTLQVGGPAKLFFIATTELELTKIISSCRQLKLPFFLFGTGTKIMISDNGFNGVVIKNRTSNIKVVSVKGKVTKFGIGVDEALIEVSSGVSMNKFVDFLIEQNLQAEEFKNLPGSIGGNIFLSRILQDKTDSVKVLNQDGRIDKFTSDKLSLSKHIVLSLMLKVKSKV